MCYAAAAYWVMAAVTAVSTAATVHNQRQNAAFEGEVAARNAAVQDQQAQQATELGAIAEQEQRQRTQRIISAQKSAMGSSGIEIGSGTFGNLLDDSAYMGEQDAQTIRANAAKQAWGYRVSSDLTSLQGDMARRAGNANANGSLLSGVGKTFGYAYQAYGMSTKPDGKTTDGR